MGSMTTAFSLLKYLIVNIFSYYIFLLHHLHLYVTMHVVDVRKGFRSLKNAAQILFINTPGKGVL